MVKRIDYDKRRMEILRQAIQMFLDQGNEDRGFVDKDEELQSMINGLVVQIHQRLKGVVEASGSSLTKIKEAIGVVGQELSQEENRLVFLFELQRSVAQDSSRLLEQVNRYSQVTRLIFEQLLKEGVAAGELQVDDFEGMAYALAVLLESFAFQIALSGQFGVEEHLEKVFYFLDGLQRR